MAKNLSPAAAPKRQRGRPRGPATAIEAGSVQSLDRAVGLLKLVAAANGLSLTELAQQSGLAPSTAYRMLTTLQAHGLLEFGEAEQLWFIGLETFRMGSAFLRRRKLAEQGRSVIQALMADSGETANLAVAAEDGVVFVSQVETHEAIRAFFRPGTRSEYHCSGVGKAILAHLAPRALEAALGRQRLVAHTPKTRTTRAALAEDLAAIRLRGFSVDDEERHLGMRCVAAAVFDENGEPVGGVSVSGPTVRLDDGRVAALGPRVAEAARQLTRAMGGRMPG
ncbi:MAG: IclR family transcriptional regulator [Rubritepida sp.]|jgi:IclR family acetate operon transcriptional repressor|nr:IclR family transcriptional regulator [Rubritepida sp.]